MEKLCKDLNDKLRQMIEEHEEDQNDEVQVLVPNFIVGCAGLNLQADCYHMIFFDTPNNTNRTGKPTTPPKPSSRHTIHRIQMARTNDDERGHDNRKSGCSPGLRQPLNHWQRCARERRGWTWEDGYHIYIYIQIYT
jgi:hypothetical protein